MEITWYGTASLILREENTSIAFDPFGGLPIHSIAHPPKALPCEQKLGSIEQVFVTHGHLDHIYHIPRLYRDTDVKVHCTAAPERTLIRHGFSPEKIQEISPGWNGQIGPFHITAYQGRHCVFDAPLLAHIFFSSKTFRHPAHLFHLLKLHLTYREKREILFYELTCHGLRIQIMGSMNLDPRTEYPTGADVLILPLQGRSDQDVYALELVKRLMPKSVLLDHYDNSFPPLSGDVDTSGFIRNVWQELGIPCQPLEFKKGVTIYEGQKEETLGRSPGRPLGTQYTGTAVRHGTSDAQPYGL